MDFSSIVSAWGAEAIEETGTARLKTRVIGAFQFQIPLLDYRERSRLGLALVAQGEKFAPLLKAGMLALGDQKADEVDRSAAVGIAVDFIPQIVGRLSEPDFYGLLDTLASKASVNLGAGKYEPLSLDHVAEKVFGDDLTLQIPVALTVAEVNLQGFFEKLGTALGFGSIKSKTDESGEV